MEECLKWVDKRINNAPICDDDRHNFEAYGNVLRNSDVMENHGGSHGGRYLLIKNGEVWSESFEYSQDTFGEEFDENWVLFRVPKDELCDKASIFCAISVGETDGNYDEVNVPVKLGDRNPTGKQR